MPVEREGGGGEVLAQNTQTKFRGIQRAEEMSWGRKGGGGRVIG